MVKVLLADDSEFMRSLLRLILLSGGHEITGEAADGVECIQMYQENRPDVVLMDILMPNKRGLDTLFELRRLDPKANVIMVSADGQRPHVDRAISYGAKGYLVKPFRKSVLLAEIQRVLQPGEEFVLLGPIKKQ